MSKVDQQIQAAHQRLKKLRWDVNHSPPAAKSDLLTEALEDFSLILETLNVITEELTVAAEELRCQNEELQAAHQTLAIEHDRYHDLFEFAPDSYLVTNPKGVIQEVNRKAADLLNVAQRFLIGKPLTVFVAQKERKPFLDQLKQLSKWGSLQDWEMCLQPREGDPLPVSISLSAITNAQDELTGWRWLIRDIAERKKLEARLYKDACYDALTNLPNRKFFLNHLEYVLKQHQRHTGRLFALLFLDLDRFKGINDRLGHHAGDLVLIEISLRLAQCLREVDVVARLGGDEFVILLDQLDQLNGRSEAADCANRIQQVLTTPISVEDHDIVINGSIGIVLSGSLETDAESLLRSAGVCKIICVNSQNQDQMY